MSKQIKTASSWWALLKELPYDGGPSSTRFVYLATAFCVTTSAVLLVLSFAFVYVHSKDHHSDVVLAGLIGTLMGSVMALSANAQNKRHSIQQQQQNTPEAGK